jgi:hypothetical protein
MPASVDRDWTLAEIRARIVDVETGMPPTPLRALPPDERETEITARRSPRTAAAAPARSKPSRRVQRPRLADPAARTPPVAVRRRGHEEIVDLLEQGAVMCLEEPPAAATGASRPWSAGLRG